MKALSVKLPWAWLLIHGGKDIENRNWFNQHKGETAIHCSATVSPSEYEACERFLAERGIRVALPSIDALKALAGKIIGTVEITGYVKQSHSRWFVGRFGFVCTKPRAIKTAIQAKGSLGFWEVSAPDVQSINDQLGGSNGTNSD